MDLNEYAFSEALIALLKGIVNEASDVRIWNTILEQQVYIEDYVSKIGLQLIISNQDGYAYLTQIDYREEQKPLPRLITKRQLKYLTSLILVLLRKELIEMNKNSDLGRYVISKTSIIEKVLPYLKDTNDEAKQQKEIETEINAIEKMGFIRLIKNSNDDYEIIPLLRTFIDAQWLQDFDEKLKTYIDYAKGDSETGEIADE
jgi:hypothetical protein